MLTAHRQEPQPGAASLDSGTQADGFAKVLTSIHGLQQRLDGFSLEEASHAEANVHTIVEQLCSIQAKLSRMTELKHFVASANRLIGEIPEQNFEQVDLDGLEDHPQLHAIIQASKLIRVHKLMQATKAGAEALSLHDEATTLRIPAPETSSFSTAESSLAAPSQPSTPRPKKTDLDEMQTVGLDATTENLPGGDWVFSADTELEDAEPQFVEHTVSVINARENKLTRQAVGKIPKPPGAETGGADRSGFDERLLSDLIQAYGEFSPVLKSCSATTQLLGAEIEQSRDHVNPSAPMPRAAAQEISSGMELIREDSTKSGLPSPEEQPNNSHDVIAAARQAPKPKTISKQSQSTTGLTLIRTNLPMLPQAQLERAEPETEKKPLPNTKKKHGELDRQLKRIIKDYGEYDLYSQQSSTNIKKLALATFAALALVLGALYFFKAPSSPRNPAASAVTQSPDTSKIFENSTDAARRPTLKPKLETNKTLTGE